MILINGIEIQQEHFPDGTFNLTKLDLGVVTNTWRIIWKYENESENMLLYFLVKHLNNVYFNPLIDLVLPYIPNARMDRVHNIKTEVFTLKYFCDFINDLNFRHVFVIDAHSSVSLGLINRVCSSYSRNNRLYQRALSEEHPDVVFFPDEGARKRYIDTEMIKEYKKIVNPDFRFAYGEKNRDWDTGKILGLTIHGDIQKGDKVLIIDDISSYGGTFYHSAKALRELGAERVSLAVTHCENNILKGAAYKEKMIDKVYTTDSIFTENNEWVEVVS